MAGQVDLSVLKLVNYWYLLKKKYDYLDEYVRQNRFCKFNVSSILNNDMPALKEIRQKIWEHCPVNTFLVCECNDTKKCEEWVNKMFTINNDANAIVLLNKEMLRFNCGTSLDRAEVITEGLWCVYSRLANHEDLKLYLYITYDKEDTVIKKCNKLIKDKKFIIHPIHFEENKSAIEPEDINFLKRLVVWLKQNPLVKLELDGHASNEWDATANMKLSIARAEKVKKQLIAYGIDANRLKTVGFGATKPLQPNDTEQGKSINRRVEFIILQ